MSKLAVQLCVLSGGAGNRLWPVSRETQPKQFYDFSGAGAPLLVETVRRLKEFGPVSVLTNQALFHATQGLLNRFNENARVIGEPLRKNTAPAVALFTHWVAQENPDTIIGIFPSDHLVKNAQAWRQSLELAIKEAANGKVVTFGIRPSHPSDAYGYIEIPQSLDSREIPFVSSVLKFVEKPSVPKAESFIATGRFAWNAGMFVFRAREMSQHFARLMPELWSEIQKLKSDLSNIEEVFARLTPESLDYGIMEKLDSIQCVVSDFDWSDVGSWEEVVQHLPPSPVEPIQINGQGNHYAAFETQARKLAFVGVSNLVAVETPDSLMILRKGDGQKLREVVKELQVQAPHMVKAHSFEERPWGRFEVLMDTEHFKSKRITVWPGHKLSYQSHKKRAEHWVIVKGEAEVTLEGESHRLKAGEHIHIPLGAKHRIANFSKDPMEFIEVQTGTYFGEDDIVRYSDDYGRK